MSSVALEGQTAPSRAELDGLVLAVARGDRQAFATLFDFYAPRVKAYLMRLNAPSPLAEEIAQEVMLTVWRKAGQFDPAQASASTWIFRIARNRRIDAVRRAAARPDPDPHDPVFHPPETEAPDEAAHAAGRAERVAAALDALPPDQLDLLRLAFFDGLSHRDIAERMSLPLGTVKSRLRLAFDKLRPRLDAGEL